MCGWVKSSGAAVPRGRLGRTLQVWASPEWLRTLSGLGVGILLPLLLLPLAHKPLATVSSTQRLTFPHPAELIGPMVIGLVLVWLLMHPPSLLIFQCLAYVASAALLLFLINFSLVFCCGWKKTRTIGPAPACMQMESPVQKSAYGRCDHERADA